ARGFRHCKGRARGLWALFQPASAVYIEVASSLARCGLDLTSLAPVILERRESAFGRCWKTFKGVGKLGQEIWAKAVEKVWARKNVNLHLGNALALIPAV
ncbi:hypothetical protein KI387_030450, partial [Taxus chinensis]